MSRKIFSQQGVTTPQQLALSSLNTKQIDILIWIRVLSIVIMFYKWAVNKRENKLFRQRNIETWLDLLADGQHTEIQPQLFKEDESENRLRRKPNKGGDVSFKEAHWT